MRTQRLSVCAAFALALAACGSSDSTATDESVAATSPAAPAATTAEVVVENYVFPAITTAPGATLSLVDRDDEPHTITADDGSFTAGPFDSDSPGTLVAPSTPGSYAIHCEIHPTMKGTLVVSDSSATPQPLVDPDTSVSPETSVSRDPYGY